MSIEARMNAVLDKLNFNFSDFTMDGFVAWVQAHIGREVRFIPWDMSSNMFGVWISDADEPVEHVFIDKNTPPLHRVHIQLHELSHIICEHPTIRLTKAQMKQMLLQALDDPGVLTEALLRSPAQEDVEQEAEILASLIQHRVIMHERLAQLSLATSSNKDLVDHLQSLELV